MNSKFTCIACRVAFGDGDLQRQHYKTDWHRYNLKRKVAELPAVTAEEFISKLLLQRQKDANAGKEQGVYCKVCRKTFQSSKAFTNHLNSKRHKEALKEGGFLASEDETNPENLTEISCPVFDKRSRRESAMSVDSDDSDIEEVDSDEWNEDTSENNPIANNYCLFCTHHSRNFEKNLKHMSLAHSFFIPDVEYLVDLKGLFLYLGEKICQGFLCIWCNDRGRTFYSMEAAQQHMVTKGHCKMLHEGETLLEYSDFYDYSGSYPDSSVIPDDETITGDILDGSDYQLVLPSGATIGHRSLMIYYRQNIDPNKVVVPARKKIDRVIAQYRSLGWKETDKQLITKKVKDLDYMKRVQSKHMMQVGVKANKLQKHFRPQVNF